MLKKPNRKSTEARAVDVPADDPVGTMERFRIGLKRVLQQTKTDKPKPVESGSHR